VDPWKFWLAKFTVSLFLGMAVLIFVVNVVFDPYGEWDLVRAPYNRLRFFQDHQTAAYQMARRLEKSPQTLIFGTSHTATLSEELFGEPLINLSVSVYGNPIDVYYFLKALSSEGWKNVTRVYFDLDFHTFREIDSDYERANFYSRFQYFLKTIEDIHLDKLQRTFYSVNHNLFDPPKAYIRENGEFVYVEDINFEPGSENPGAGAIKYTHAEKAMSYLGKVDEILKEHRVPVIYFTPIFSRYFLRGVDLASLKDQYEMILNEVPRLVALTYVPAFSDDNKFFRDSTHHKYAVSAEEVRILRAPNKYPEYVVTKENLADYFTRLEAALGKKEKAISSIQY
jgi:hypothetical protein